MEKDLIKNISLLKFYHKSGTPINLKLSNNPNLNISGVITDKNFLFGEKFIIIRNKQNQPIKIFIEDILSGSIFPEGYSNSVPEQRQNNKRSLVMNKDTGDNNRTILKSNSNMFSRQPKLNYEMTEQY